MSRGIEEMEVKLNAGGMQESAGFSICIAKISQGLQKFRNHSENFAIPAKFFYEQFFSMIEKFRYHSETTVHRKNLNFRYASGFRYDSEISLS